ncbi:MAG: thioredoxin domain-containing protein, partial [Desulfotignum sp.]
QWLVPHFEKMLYDNALLAVAYLEAWQTTANADFQRVVNEILTYTGRDMTSPEGAFYSATDADSKNIAGHMEEGWYFTWTPEELEIVLGKERADIVKKYYAVEGPPNFEGRYIFHTPKNRTDIAAELHMSKDNLTAVIEESKKLLFRERNKRPAPLRDEKILTAWNALMISAFARAGLAFGNSAYTLQAKTAARFILDHLYINGRLYRSYKDGQARHNGFLEDYAFFIAALVDLYEADHDIWWLKKALALDDVLKKFYEDLENGGFFTTGTDHEALIAREKPFYDGATPSGNAVAALNLLRLYSYTTDDQFRRRVKNLFKAFCQRLTDTPSALSEMLLAMDYYFDTPAEIILITPPENPDAAMPFLDKFREQFIPNRILVAADEKQAAANAEIIPLAAGKKAAHGRATAYVCESGTCSLPAETPEEFVSRLLRDGTA